MTSEDLLIKQAKSGDEAAFEKIVKLYEKSVYTSSLYIAKNHADALDISQEVFVKLWRTLPYFRNEASLKTWIATITHTCAVDYIRKRERTQASSLTLEDDEKEIDVIDDDTASDPQKYYERKEQTAAVRKAVKALPEPLKQTLILREFQELSYEEIANVQKLSIGTVKSRINRARAFIKEFLKNENFL